MATPTGSLRGLLSTAKLLVTSRKFWLTLIPMISAVALFIHGGITPDQLANALTAGFGILVFSIAHEDNGASTVVNSADTIVNPGPEANAKGNGDSK